MSLAPVVLTTQSVSASTGPQGNLHSRYPRPSRGFPEHGPRSDYLANLQEPSYHVENPKPKSCLLVLDIDNTLISPVDRPGKKVAARPFLRPFMKWVTDPRSPYAVAFWSFSGRCWAIAHLRAVELGDLLFQDDDPTDPKLAPGVLAVRGYEDSGLTEDEMSRMTPPSVKDLQLMWDSLNLNAPARGATHWGPENTVICDDQSPNAACQPANLILADFYDDHTDPTTDDFLVVLIGALDELAHEDNIAYAIQKRGWNAQGLPVEEDKLFAAAVVAAAEEDITISHPHPIPKTKRVDVSDVHPALLDAPAHDAQPGPAPAAAHDAVMDTVQSIRPRIGIPQSALPAPVTIPSSTAAIPAGPPSSTSTSSFTDNENDPVTPSSDDDSEEEESDPDDNQPSRFVSEEESLNHRSGSGRSDKQRLADAVADWERDAPDASVPLTQNEPYTTDRASYFRSDLAAVRGSAQAGSGRY